MLRLQGTRRGATYPTGISIRRFLILSSLVGVTLPNCELSYGRSICRSSNGDLGEQTSGLQGSI